MGLGVLYVSVMSRNVNVTGIQAVGCRRRRAAGYRAATQDSDELSHRRTIY